MKVYQLRIIRKDESSYLLPQIYANRLIARKDSILIVLNNKQKRVIIKEVEVLEKSYFDNKIQ